MGDRQSLRAAMILATIVWDDRQRHRYDACRGASNRSSRPSRPAEGQSLACRKVFGSVHQSGGFVRLASMVGLGTTVRIYLPRHDMVEGVGLQDVRDVPMRDSEAIIGTVLVVEDEADLHAFIVEVLCDLGCRVIEAANGNAGLRFLRSRGQVDLLMSDVGLPGMNGRQLAATARETRPGLSVLLITGYAGAAVDDTSLRSAWKSW
jgi:CheY-like chemotaxis protein